jgi:hypothetical protein
MQPTAGKTQGRIALIEPGTAGLGRRWSLKDHVPPVQAALRRGALVRQPHVLTYDIHKGQAADQRERGSAACRSP